MKFRKNVQSLTTMQIKLTLTYHSFHRRICVTKTWMQLDQKEDKYNLGHYSTRKENSLIPFILFCWTPSPVMTQSTSRKMLLKHCSCDKVGKFSFFIQEMKRMEIRKHKTSENCWHSIIPHGCQCQVQNLIWRKADLALTNTMYNSPLSFSLLSNNGS